MTEPFSTVGFVVIIIWYAVIGLLATAGSVAVTQKFFPGRSEQIFYGAILVLIAGYLPGSWAYFGNVSSWRTELIGVIAFSVLGIVGTRYAAVLILGYTLHGIWDAVHEFCWAQRLLALCAEAPSRGEFCALFVRTRSPQEYLK